MLFNLAILLRIRTTFCASPCCLLLLDDFYRQSRVPVCDYNNPNRSINQHHRLFTINQSFVVVSLNQSIDNHSTSSRQSKAFNHRHLCNESTPFDQPMKHSTMVVSLTITNGSTSPNLPLNQHRHRIFQPINQSINNQSQMSSPNQSTVIVSLPSTKLNPSSPLSPSNQSTIWNRFIQISQPLIFLFKQSTIASSDSINQSPTTYSNQSTNQMNHDCFLPTKSIDQPSSAWVSHASNRSTIVYGLFNQSLQPIKSTNRINQ